jgi:hypothetical protein
MEPAANVLPKIEASHYADFRDLIVTLPPTYEAWSNEVRAPNAEAVSFRTVRPDQFRDFLERHRRQDSPTKADLFRCAGYLWNRDLWRSDW